MPRPRTGLGQGLEALVPPIREPNSAISRFSRSEDGAVQWEVAVLRKLRKRRCRLVVAPSAVLEKPARQVLKTSTLLALGALGAAGWELTAVSRGKFYLKRHAVQPGD